MEGIITFICEYMVCLFVYKCMQHPCVCSYGHIHQSMLQPNYTGPAHIPIELV
jgi:hypothetical protein